MASNNQQSNKRPMKGNAISLLPKPDNYTIIDIETTGLSSKYDYIAEVSGVKYRNNQEVEHYTSLVRPLTANYNGFLIPANVAQMTHITHEMLQHAPALYPILLEYAEFIGDDILIGHNINFDYSFLYDYFESMGIGTLNNDYLDTIQLAKQVFPNLPRTELGVYTLENLSRILHVDYEGAHRSLTDCYICKQVYDKLINYYEKANPLESAQISFNI